MTYAVSDCLLAGNFSRSGLNTETKALKDISPDALHFLT